MIYLYFSIFVDLHFCIIMHLCVCMKGKHVFKCINLNTIKIFEVCFLISPTNEVLYSTFRDVMETDL